MYYRDRSHLRTEAREWISRVCHILSHDDHQELLKDLREAYDPKKSYFVVDIKYEFPHKKLFTKDGRLKTPDVSNIEKPLVDIFFSQTYHQKKLPYGCPNINHDDKYVKKMISEKCASEDDAYWIEFTVIIEDYPSKSPDP